MYWVLLQKGPFHRTFNKWSLRINFYHFQRLLYTGLFLQTVLPYLEFALTKLWLKRGNLRHWNSPCLKFARWWGQKVRKIKWAQIFPGIQHFPLKLLITVNITKPIFTQVEHSSLSKVFLFLWKLSWPITEWLQATRKVSKFRILVRRCNKWTLGKVLFVF